VTRSGIRIPSRVDAVDAARGIALLGMMLVHVGPHGEPSGSPAIGQVVAGGRAAPLFAVLAGVALSLVHRRDPRGVGSVRATIVRGVLLVVLGLGLGSLDDVPVYVILASYGLMIVVALPFRTLPTRVLLLVTLGWIAVAPFVVIGTQVLHEPVIAMQSELAELGHPLDLGAELLVWGAYPAIVWFAYVLVGLLVGRLDLRSARTAWRLAGLGAALVVLTVGLAWWLISGGAVDDRSSLGWELLVAPRAYPYAEASWNDLLLLGEHTSAPLNVVSAIGSALLVIGVCALLVRLPWARLALLPVRAAGAMTLTLYTAHVLGFWRAATSGAYDRPDVLTPGTWSHWLLQAVALVGFAMIWQRQVGRGPLESAVRLLSVTAWRGGHEKTPRPEPGR
jgi:uncharacterized protein